MGEIEELIEELIKRLGGEDFDHVVDEVEWKSPEFNHQN